MFCFRFVSFRSVLWSFVIVDVSFFFLTRCDWNKICGNRKLVNRSICRNYIPSKKKKKMRVAKQRAIFRKFFFSLLNSGFLSGSCQDSPWFPLFLYFPLFLFLVFVFSLMGLDFFFLFTLSPFPIFLPLSPVPLISAVTSVPRFLLL